MVITSVLNTYLVSRSTLRTYLESYDSEAIVSELTELLTRVSQRLQENLTGLVQTSGPTAGEMIAAVVTRSMA